MSPSSSSSPPGSVMTEERFWALLDGTAAGGVEQQADVVRQRLARLSADELVAYEKRLVDLSNGILTWRHLGAAEVILGFASDDVFTDVRTWVLFQGREVYTAFRADPDSLAGYGPDDDEEIGGAEELEYLAHDLYRNATGSDLLDRSDYPEYLDEPAGEPIDRSNAALVQRYPKLAARYMRGVDPAGRRGGGPRPIS